MFFKDAIPRQLIRYPSTLSLFHLKHMLINLLCYHGVAVTCQSFTSLGASQGSALHFGKKKH